MKKQYLDESFELLQQFLSYMQNVKGRSENTVNEYFISLRTFFRYMKKHKGIVDENIEEEKIEIDDIDLDFIKTISFNDISYFMNYCISTRNNGAAARARKSCAIRVFFNFLYQKLNLIDYDPSKGLDTPKLSKKLPKFLSLEQSIELLNTIDGKYKERDYCILTLFLNCGMRLSELVGINIKDINFEECQMNVIGKGNKQRTIYLNKACFNGLYRVNSKNEFNVPFGKKEKINTYEGNNLITVSNYLTMNDIKILCVDFEVSVKDAKKGDFVYFDPPYDSDTSTFNSYTEEGFGKEEQIRLAKLFKELSDKGVYVMLSNHNTILVKELYKDYHVHVIEAKRNINSNGKKRGKVEEVIITNYVVNHEFDN